MEKYNIPSENTLDPMEGIEQKHDKDFSTKPNEEYSPQKSRECMPDEEFRKRLKEQIYKPTEDEDNDYGFELRSDAHEFIIGVEKLLLTARESYEDYWGNLISLSGNQAGRFDNVSVSNRNPFYLDEHRKALRNLTDLDSHWDTKDGSDVGQSLEQILHLAFDLYACISVLKPDTIVTLTNGARRIHALCDAIGFDSKNYLSIHRKHEGTISSNSYRKGIEGLIYEGKKIEPGSRVLILEDTSDLMEGGTTYKIAREWLKEQGVTDSPVFFEQIYQTMDHGKWSRDSEFVLEYQKKLNKDNGYNSDARFPSYNELYENMETKLSFLILNHTEKYQEFFDVLRNLGKSKTRD